MPYEIRTGPVLEIRFFGTLTNDELLEGCHALREHESGPHAPHRISDLRGVTKLDLTFEGVSALVDERLRTKFSNPFKSAIIAPDLAHYGFARMFQTLNDHDQIAVAIFPDEASARAWIAEPGQALPERPWAPSRAVA